MAYKITKIRRPKLDKVFARSITELDSFFKIVRKHGKPTLILVDDRKTIDALQGRKTEDWVVGFASGRIVYLLNDKYYEKESCHKYSDAKYFALMKHEIAHCFSSVVSKFSWKPRWLHEGLSVFLSGQIKLKPKPNKYKSFLSFYNKGGKGVYAEAGSAVEFLIKKYGKQKLISLLRKAKTTNSKKDFARLFKSIYNFELAYKNFKVL